MKNELLKEFLKQRSTPCVSLIISTGIRSFTDKNKILKKINKMIEECEEEIEEKYPAEISQPLINSLYRLIGQVDLDHLQKGVGLFFSQNYTRLLYFELPVVDKIIIGNSFVMRDLVANLNVLSRYNVLLLTRKRARLFKGMGPELREILDAHFPHEYKEEFQLEKKHPAPFYREEESKLNQARLEDFFREIDHLLKDYLQNNPLILLGVEKELHAFREITSNKDLVIGEIKGNYDKNSIYALEKLVEPVLSEYRQNEDSKVVEMAREAIYRQKAVSGIQEVWNMVNQGIGSELIVETDFVTKAFLHSPSAEFILEDGQTEEMSEIPDAVDSVIEKLLQQHGTQIHFVKDGALKDYGRIVLITKNYR